MPKAAIMKDNMKMNCHRSAFIAPHVKIHKIIISHEYNLFFKSKNLNHSINFSHFLCLTRVEFHSHKYCPDSFLQ